MFSTAFIFYLFYYKSVILFVSYFIWIRVCYVIYTCHLIYIIRESKNCWIFSTIDPSITRLIGSTVYRNRVERNQNSVMETFLLPVDGSMLQSYAIWNRQFLHRVISKPRFQIAMWNVFMADNIRKNKLLFHRKVSISVRICDNWPS